MAKGPWCTLKSRTHFDAMPDELLRIRDGVVPLAEAWRALRNGSFIVAEGHSTDTEHALSLEPRTSGEPPHGEDLSILEDYFRRGSQSALAIERGVNAGEGHRGDLRPRLPHIKGSRPPRAHLASRPAGVGAREECLDGPLGERRRAATQGGLG